MPAPEPTPFDKTLVEMTKGERTRQIPASLVEFREATGWTVVKAAKAPEKKD